MVMDRRRAIIAGAPHIATLTGSLVHFSTDMKAPMEISGSGNITITGKNLIDNSLREQYGADTVYVGMTEDSSVYLKAGNYRFSATLINGTEASLFYRKPDEVSATNLTMFNNNTASAVFTVPEDGYYQFYFYTNEGISSANIRDCCLSVDADTGYEPYTSSTEQAGVSRKSLVGINNVFSDSGSITVKYWTH